MSELLDNGAHRVRTLKHIIKHLHAGEAPEEIKAQLKQLVKECDTTEIAQMEQELMAEGVPAAEIMGMCDLHSQVVKEILVDRPNPLLLPGHPVKTFQAENEAIERQVGALREALTKLTENTDNGDPPLPGVNACRALLNDLMDIAKHYDRKENLLFPMLERHDITGPSTVMWGKDDEVRELLNAVHTALGQDDVSGEEWALVISTVAEPALTAATEMIYKEEKILFPMALQTLTDMEWGEIWQQSPQFGWCLVDPQEGYQPPPATTPEVPNTVLETAERDGIALNIVPPSEGRAEPVAGSIILPTGALTLEQLKMIFSTLPVDLTFVDADDRVRFFSEGPKRVFARPKAVIGRLVQHCHPPGSIHIVEQIVSDFKSGAQDVAEFWIEFQGRFVHIRYFALRDNDGTYLGTLEVTQDISHERALEGERRLLAYE